MSDKIKPTHLDAWRLFITAHARLINQIDSELAQAEQIPLNWYDVLIELYEAPERRLRMADLAAKVVLSRSGLTRLVDRLEKEKYLYRELDPEDRRGFYAVLTDEGANVMRKAWATYAQGIQEHFAMYLSDEDAVRLTQIFNTILDKL
jgi:DNA-binding MarR family transcriptional regulator